MGRRAFDKSRRRNSIRLEKPLCKTLARFQTRLVGGWTDNGPTGFAEEVHNAETQRYFRTDNCEIDLASRYELDESNNIVRRYGHKLGLLSDAAVAWSRENLGDSGV